MSIRFSSTTADFNGTTEPMRAIRDLISACEAVFGADCGEDGILRRAQDALTALRALQGDTRPAEDIAFAAMIEPRNLYQPLQLTAAALQAVIAARNIDLLENIRFTGKWERFGSLTLTAILDRANTALEAS